jgi:hypothetical protein
MCSAAISRRRCLSLPSSIETTLPLWRWVLRCWPTTRQARRSEARLSDDNLVEGPINQIDTGHPVTLLQGRDNPSHREVLLSAQRRSGLRSFPRQDPTAAQKPAARASLSPALPPPEASTPSEKPSARAGRSPSPAKSASWPPRPASRRTAAANGNRSAASPR